MSNSYCSGDQTSKLLQVKVSAFLTSNIDRQFNYCPIVTAVSAHYEVQMHKQVRQLYTFMQQSRKIL
ncbi:MAG: hypothetical protein F6K17_23275 [Okeania sp. SIO3C4]|nr:hypothetical protein [Okeania sp. SIO3B3]NER05306.1 hypothetical protein [Okeania sp. SIO3C4]